MSDNTRKVKSRLVYEHVDIHMIFDINMYRDFTRKSILVSDNHTYAPQSYLIYSSVVYRERYNEYGITTCTLEGLGDIFMWYWKCIT